MTALSLAISKADWMVASQGELKAVQMAAEMVQKLDKSSGDGREKRTAVQMVDYLVVMLATTKVF